MGISCHCAAFIFKLHEQFSSPEYLFIYRFNSQFSWMTKRAIFDNGGEHHFNLRLKYESCTAKSLEASSDE